MKLRTQLLLVFIALAVIPVASLVISSYVSSRASFRRAVNAESERMAESMTRRLEEIKGQLRSRLEFFSRLSETAGEVGEGDVLTVLGEDVRLLERLDLAPAPPPPPGAPAPPGEQAPATPPPARAEPLEIRSPRQLQELLASTKQRLEEARVRLRVAVGEDAAAESASGEGVEMPLLREFPLRLGDRQLRLRGFVDRNLLVERVLDSAHRDRGEIPFAVGPDGSILTRTQEDRQRLHAVLRVREPEAADAASGQGPPLPELEPAPDGWVVATRGDAESGLVFGIARPVDESLQEIRRSAARSLGWGLALIGLALLGMLPISARISRNLAALTRGAQRLASGDLTARVPVRSEDEFGQLARAFNLMAVDLSRHQERLVEQARLRKEEEIERRLLAAENRRKTAELEEARRFQLSMLPARLPEHPGLEIAVFTRTATEVGGDYYDFQTGDDGSLTVAIGDATGHGARAGTMVAVIKGLFSAHAARADLVEFLADATVTIKRMGLGRIAMALALARFEGRRLTVASAGMPPVLVRRAGASEESAVEEVAIEGMPLGGIAGFPYRREQLHLEAGDTVLLMTDGFPEVRGPGGEPQGYGAVRDLFARCDAQTPQEIITRFTQALESRLQGAPLEDDVTFVVLRAR